MPMLESIQWMESINRETNLSFFTPPELTVRIKTVLFIVSFSANMYLMIMMINIEISNVKWLSASYFDLSLRDFWYFVFKS